MDKKLIRQKIRHKQKWIGTTYTKVFDSNVPESKLRYVVKIIITGDQSSTRVLNLYKVKEDGSYEDFIPNINVAAPEYKEIPEGSYDIENPIITLEGGTNLAGMIASGNTLSITVIYWDND